MTRRFALLGHPVSHSRSPALHTHWFHRHGLDASYEAVDLDPGRAAAVVQVFRDSPFEGANLTVPFKSAAIDFLDALTPLARAAGSVNTLWRDGDRVCGDTTDAPGFVSALRASGPVDPARPAAILGAGGAGRAVAAGLAGAGWSRIALLNRSTARAQEAIAALAGHFPHTTFTAGPLTDFDPPTSGLVAVCVSGPGRDAVRGLSIADLPPDARWCDLNYWDPAPPHRIALNDRFDDGSAMLVHQAALAFARWTGISPDPRDLPDEPP